MNERLDDTPGYLKNPGAFPPMPPNFSGSVIPELRDTGPVMPQMGQPMMDQPQMMPQYQMPQPAGEMLQERFISPMENASLSPQAQEDLLRTSTMRTGYQPPISGPPPIYDYTGTGGLGGLAPMPPHANNLLPPANQNEIGNWGGGAAGRQDWTGPLVNPLITPWSYLKGNVTDAATFGGIYGDEGYRAARNRDRMNDMRNFGQEYGAYALNPMAYPGQNWWDLATRNR